ncbi:hypothetical protein A1O1_07094 [Capronia coronata CBS 617.96]|uniref:Uncharacterized protein n=1 Tax=Capronia coronata CBS 617.96 TaxID=1182541 RepID=W9Y2L7_9EURO|nr:uncharacterized protein A1O1_07094 [Capronia coronata CBS 617.96]EXJ83471.1 hypothetical protein A1O1_07094 [Capronia coronata CBS 617.96]
MVFQHGCRRSGHGDHRLFLSTAGTESIRRLVSSRTLSPITSASWSLPSSFGPPSRPSCPSWSTSLCENMLRSRRG